MTNLQAVEICAGAGGQALGLELAGFDHALAVELDTHAATTLRHNRPAWTVAVGDVADRSVWKPKDYAEVDLLAGGVPCPPFSIAGKQLGASDERDLFAWAVERVAQIRPRALLLENVRGLAAPRFSAYRQHVHDRLWRLGYWSEWRLLHASDFDVPQLRPRFVLVALRKVDAPFFQWPETTPTTETVGSALKELMAAGGWPGADAWAERAGKIAPTIVGGSKKHGGADLGPTRAKQAWAELGVDGLGVADEPPASSHPKSHKPRLTCDMVARLQGWKASEEFAWEFMGGKTARYRQIGNAFPPPVARAVGNSIRRALNHEEGAGEMVTTLPVVHDPIFRALKDLGRPATRLEISDLVDIGLSEEDFQRRILNLGRDFEIERAMRGAEPTYRLGQFKGFTGQANHERNARFLEMRAKIS